MKTQLQLLKEAIGFTEVYKSHSDKYLREAHCLRYQLQNVLVPIYDDDLICGFMQHGLVGFSPQYGGLYTYYFNEHEFKNALEAVRSEAETGFIYQCEAMGEFWRLENTRKKAKDRFISMFDHECGLGYSAPGCFNADCRIAGVNVDLDKLIRLGLCGLMSEIDQAAEKNKNNSFYDALKLSLLCITDACDFYIADAKQKLINARPDRKAELTEIIQTLTNIKTRPPQTFREGLQLMWIYAVVSDLMNYGRMDVYLGDLYTHDLDAGNMTEETAISYLLSLYRHLKRIGKIHDCRIIIGGLGRRNEENADRLSMAIMEASRRFKEVLPQLTLRYYTGMKEEIYTRALELNGEGLTFPIIYSDDTNVPALMQLHGLDYDTAVKYVPFGCGEFVLEGASVATPNSGINLAKALEITLHNGMDHFQNVFTGLATGTLEELDTFDKLWNAYTKQLTKGVREVAYHDRLNYSVAAENAGYLYISLLMDDCIAKGKPFLAGGARYLNATSEIFGIMTAADSFTAIMEHVYTKKNFTLPQLVHMLDCNFEGYEKERAMLLASPKYGNDNEIADAMAIKVFNHIAELIEAEGQRVGFDNYNIVAVNNSMSAQWGYLCEATPCGRKRSDPLSNGNGPSIGADKNGFTSLLNSMSKCGIHHAGVINNIRFSKELFQNSFEKVKALLRVFYQNDGVQTNICVVGAADLKNAMERPQEYPNLLVRIGGFSARFIELDRIVQQEIIDRMTY